MGTNIFFRNYDNSMEQNVFEDLIIESIKIYGEDMYYIPRQLNNKDEVYGEDTISSYDKIYMVELYIKSVDGFTGDGNFMSKFGLEIRDQVTFTIAKRVFENEITLNESHIIRPREGDLIYFPLNKKLFQIKYADNKPTFYQLGALQIYDLTCELFEYSNESFNTGIPEIDDIQQKLSTNVFDYALLTEDGRMLLNENGNVLVNEKFDIEVIDPFADNDSIQEESDTFLDWSVKNPFASDGIGI